jgi:hypothetical protein
MSRHPGIHVSFQLSSTGIQGPPCPRTPAQRRTEVSFPSVSRQSRASLGPPPPQPRTRVGIVGNWHRGTAQLSQTTDRLTENTETQNTTDPRAVRRCALDLRWIAGLPAPAPAPAPAPQGHGLQKFRTQLAASVHSSGPAGHQPPAHQDLCALHS